METPDGNIHEYIANIIAEHLWDQVDDDGWDYGILYEIIGRRRKEDAISTDQGFVETKSGNEKRVITTKGWDIRVKWENGETTWVPLKVIKESNAIFHKIKIKAMTQHAPDPNTDQLPVILMDDHHLHNYFHPGSIHNGIIS